jgi:hypothetical protein
VIASIDVEALLELAWVAPVAAVLVSSAFSLIVLGSARAADSRRAGATGAAVAYGALAVVASIAFAGMVIAAISVIVAK